MAHAKFRCQTLNPKLQNPEPLSPAPCRGSAHTSLRASAPAPACIAAPAVHCTRSQPAVRAVEGREAVTLNPETLNPKP